MHSLHAARIHIVYRAALYQDITLRRIRGHCYAPVLPDLPPLYRKCHSGLRGMGASILSGAMSSPDYTYTEPAQRA